MCKCYYEGDATAAAAASDAGTDSSVGGGTGAGQMHQHRTLALCSGGISHQASSISLTLDDISRARLLTFQ